MAAEAQTPAAPAAPPGGAGKAPPPEANGAPAPAGGAAPSGPPAGGGLPSNDQLAAKAFRDFEAAQKAFRDKKAAEAKGEGGDNGASTKVDKVDGGKAGSGGQNGKAAPPAAKADGGKAEPPKAEGHGGAQRDEHGRFMAGEGGGKAETPGKADGPPKADAGKAPEGEAKADRPPPKKRQVPGREGREFAEVTDDDLRDDAFVERMFTAVSRDSRQARDRAIRAEQAEQRLAAARREFEAAQKAAQSDPDRLSRRELLELAESDPYAALERLGLDPGTFHKRLLSAGTPEARVESLERRIARERQEAEARQREQETQRERQEREEAEAARRRAAEEHESNWGEIRSLLMADDSRPALAKRAERAPRYVRERYESVANDVFREVCEHNPHIRPEQVARALTAENRRTLFDRALDRLEEEFAEEFGAPPPRVNLGGGDATNGRGGPNPESGAGPRSPEQGRPEGTHTLTPRHGAEGGPGNHHGIVKPPHVLQREAWRAFERARDQRRGALPTSHALAARDATRAPRRGPRWQSQTLRHTKHSSRPCFRTTRSSAWSIAIARCSPSSRRTRTSTAAT